MEEATSVEATPESAPVDAAETSHEEAAPLNEGDDQQAEGEDDAGPDWDRMVTVKVDGEDRDVPLGELRKNYSLRAASHKKMQEAADLRKRVGQQESDLREMAAALKDPNVLADALEQLGHTREDIMAALDKRAAITPEQRRRQAFESEQAKFRSEKAAFDKQIRDQTMTAAVARETERLTTSFNKALDTHGLKGNLPAIERMAAIKSIALDAGYEMSADECAEQAIEEMRGSTTRSTKGLNAAQLRDMLGPEAIKLLLEDSLDVAIRPGPRPTAPTKAKSNGAPPRRRLSVSQLPDNFFDS